MLSKFLIALFSDAAIVLVFMFAAEKVTPGWLVFLAVIGFVAIVAVTNSATERPDLQRTGATANDIRK